MNNTFDLIVSSETWLLVDFSCVLHGYHKINLLREIKYKNNNNFFYNNNFKRITFLLKITLK